MRRYKIFVVSILVVFIGACATVRKEDLDAWVGVPVEALDTHSFFITIPMVRTRTESGIEIRNYANGHDVARCFGNARANSAGNFVTANAFSTCSSDRVVCNNIFYIKDGKVVEYAPTGQCATAAFLQPEARYLKLRAQ